MIGLLPERCDAVVVGAGPAGSVCAYALAERGRSVVLVEARPFPRWKVCGACLNGGAVAALGRAGVGHVLDQEGARPLVELDLRTGGERASVPLSGSMVLGRTQLDAALVEAGEEEGVRFLSGTRAELGPANLDGRVVFLRHGAETKSIRASLVIDATGLGPGLVEPSARRLASDVKDDSLVGLGAMFADEDDVLPGVLSMVVGVEGYVGRVRLQDGTLNVGAAVDPSALRRLGPEEVIAAILDSAGVAPPGSEPVLGWRGTPALTRMPQTLASDRVLRIGDAAGYLEPFTGEGMCWALEAGLEAAHFAPRPEEAWTREHSRAWTLAQRRRLSSSSRVCRALAWGLRRPRVTTLAVAAAGRAPWIATPVVRAASRGARSRRAT